MAEHDGGDDQQSGPLDGIVKSIDQYEYIAVIIPGATLLLGVALAVNSDAVTSAFSDFSIGALGVLLIVAFVVGHLVRTVGDVLEIVMWCPTGMPTDWVPAGKLVDFTSVQQHLRTVLKSPDFDLAAYADIKNRDAWRAIVRQVNAVVSKAKRGARVDSFNRTYGLLVGITVALIADALLLWATHASVFGIEAPWPALIAGVAALLALLRAYHFGRLYGRELFVQFLSVPAA